MLRTPKSLWVLFLLLPLISFDALGNIPVDNYDDYVPEVNARVARIKLLDGEAQIKRSDSDKWERATQNLPLVEGDEITTNSDTRVELQFDKNNYLHLSANAVFKIVNLQTEGIAVSLSQGSMNVTILKFDKDEGYFEIDSPQTTIAIQKNGVYRIDAGDENKQEVRVVVTNWGQARVYSNDSGFLLKSGRIAKLFLDGEFAGEWETSRNSSYGDDFDKWTASRNTIIERNLRNSYYNQYYDDSIYGADDLNDHGSWVYARNYGYVWKPYKTAISRYRNWSPYRYGHWRMIPYHGWSWVNDEPWGWATYHYGRWIYLDGNWAWTPYSGYRGTRSFWRPAIVFLTTVGNNYCWYPLPYNYGYYDYNRNYRRRRNRNRRNDSQNDRDNRNNPTGRRVIPLENIERGTRIRTPPHRRVPRSGVVTVPADAFGSTRQSTRRTPPTIADTVLTRKPVVAESPPFVPTVTSKGRKEVYVPNTLRTIKRRDVKIGASERKIGTPLDEKLRRQTIFGNRTPQVRTRNNSPSGNKGSTRNSSGTNRRRTGVFDRTKPRSNSSEINRIQTERTRRSTTTNSSTTKSTTPRTTTTRQSIPSRPTSPTRRSQPRSKPRNESRRSQSPSRPSSLPPRRSSPPPKRTKPKPRPSSPSPKRSKPAPKKEAKPPKQKSKSKSFS